MKYLFSLILLIVVFSCDKAEIEGYNENLVKDLKGTWKLVLNNEPQGTISFSKGMQLSMQSARGNIQVADYNIAIDERGNELENAFVITYGEDENGNEILTDEDYEEGGITCKLYPINETSAYITNLPYYRTNKITLIKQ